MDLSMSMPVWLRGSGDSSSAETLKVALDPSPQSLGEDGQNEDEPRKRLRLTRSWRWWKWILIPVVVLLLIPATQVNRKRGIDGAALDACAPSRRNVEPNFQVHDGGGADAQHATARALPAFNPGERANRKGTAATLWQLIPGTDR